MGRLSSRLIRFAMTAALLAAGLPLAKAAVTVTWGTPTINVMTGAASVTPNSTGLDIAVSASGTSFQITQPYTIGGASYVDKNGNTLTDLGGLSVTDRYGTATGSCVPHPELLPIGGVTACMYDFGTQVFLGTTPGSLTFNGITYPIAAIQGQVVSRGGYGSIGTFTSTYTMPGNDNVSASRLAPGSYVLFITFYTPSLADHAGVGVIHSYNIPGFAGPLTGLDWHLTFTPWTDSRVNCPCT